MRLNNNIIIIVAIGWLGMGIPATAANADVTENFTGEGFSPMNAMGDASLGRLRFVDAKAELSHAPRDFYNAVWTEKSYAYDLSQATWFHFSFKMSKQLLGQDMYTTLRFLNEQGAELGSLTIGINGEQHWQQVYADGSQAPACSEKTTDDEFFISVSPELFPGAPDTRLRYPESAKTPYTSWTSFSVRYDPPGLSGDPARGKFAFFVNGSEVPLQMIDDPNHSVDPHTTALNGMGMTTVQLRLLSMNDGFEHGYTGNKYGQRARGCYARKTPAIPSALTFPAKFAGNDGSALKAQWMEKFDDVAALMITEIQGFHADYPQQVRYQPTRSTPQWLTPVVPPANPLGMFGLYASYYNYLRPELAGDPTYAALRQDLAAAVWNRVYAGAIDFEPAVLMGAIDLPSPSHVIWQYLPPGTRDRLADTLARYARFYPPSMSHPEKFVWDTLYGGYYGGTSWADAVHFGYLEPGAVRLSAAWQYLSNEERATIPEESIPTTSVMYWGSFRISRNK